jgi:hypothetical protein
MLPREHLLRLGGLDLRFEISQASRKIARHVFPATCPLDEDAEVVDLAGQRVAELDVLREATAPLQNLLRFLLVVPERGIRDAGFERGEFVGGGGPVKDSSGDRWLA